MLLEKVPGLTINEVIKAPISFSGDEVYFIKKGYNNKDVYVKISNSIDGYHETKNLIWLSTKIKTPEVYDYGMIDTMSYCIMECVQGDMFQQTFTKENKKEKIIQFAKILKEFHQIDPTGLPYNRNLEIRLQQCFEAVQNDQVNTNHFEKELQGKTSKEVYQLLLQYTPKTQNNVLCHGDVCFPNILISKENIVTVIDVASMGVLDYYVDLAIGLRTIRYNLEAIGETLTTQMIELFMNSYGETKIDYKKLNYYILLDELTIR